MLEPRNNNELPAIPGKRYFTIGEVSELCGVKPHVLRYWESEFSALSPRKSSSGQRMFRRRDVELLLRIKHLLYDRKYSYLSNGGGTGYGGMMTKIIVGAPGTYGPQTAANY